MAEIKQKGDLTCLKVEVDAIEDYAEYMKNKFPLALQRFKELTGND